MNGYQPSTASSYYPMEKAAPSPAGSEDSGVGLSPRSHSSDSEDSNRHQVNNYTTLKSTSYQYIQPQYEPISPYSVPSPDYGCSDINAQTFNSAQFHNSANKQQQQPAHVIYRPIATKNNCVDSNLQHELPTCLQQKKGNAKPRQTSASKRPKKASLNKKAAVNPRAKTVRARLEELRKKGGNNALLEMGTPTPTPASQPQTTTLQVKQKQVTTTSHQSTYPPSTIEPLTGCQQKYLSVEYEQPQENNNQVVYKQAQNFNSNNNVLKPQVFLQQTTNNPSFQCPRATSGILIPQEHFPDDVGLDIDLDSISTDQLLFGAHELKYGMGLPYNGNQTVDNQEYPYDCMINHAMDNDPLQQPEIGSFHLSGCFKLMDDAVSKKDINKLINLSRTSGFQVALEEHGADGMYLALKAAQSGFLDAIRLFIQCKPEIISQYNPLDQSNLLHFAVTNSHTHVLKFLLEHIRVRWQYHYKLVDQKSCREEITPLHIACKNSNDDIVRMLIESGASVNLKDGTGYNALHLAAKSGNFNSVKYVVEAMDNQMKKGPQNEGINEKTPENNTALHFAAGLSTDIHRCYQQNNIIEYLLQKGANPFICNSNNIIPIKLVPHNSNAYEMLARCYNQQPQQQQEIKAATQLYNNNYCQSYPNGFPQVGDQFDVMQTTSLYQQN